MVSMNQTYFHPGALEVFCGPMKCGKTRELINRLDRITYVDDIDFIIFKPKVGQRSDKLISSFGKLDYECVLIDKNRPEDALRCVGKNHNVVVFDEVHFFDDSIIDVIFAFQKHGKNILAAGLDLDFRGEPFGCMPKLLSVANHIVKLTSICQHPGCNLLATRTQKLIDGKPAKYFTPTVMFEDGKDHYEPRCLKHHTVLK